MVQDGEEDMLNRNIVVLHLVGSFFRGSEDLVRFLGDVDLIRFTAGAADLRELFDDGAQGLGERVRLDVHFGKQLGDQAVGLLEQRKGKMRCVDLHVLIFNGKILGVFDGFQRFLCAFLCVHIHIPPIYRASESLISTLHL